MFYWSHCPLTACSQFVQSDSWAVLRKFSQGTYIGTLTHRNPRYSEVFRVIVAIFAYLPCIFSFSGIINQWQQESKDKVISLLLTHLPLLKPGNLDAKVEYMKLLPKILAHSIEHNQHIEESRQLLSYALIHPATSLEDRSALAMWLNHLEDRTSTSFGGQNRGRSDSVDYGQTHYYHQRQNSDDKLNGWQNSRDSGICINASNWQDKGLGCENGHVPLYSSSSVPTTINTIGTSTSTSKSPGSPLAQSGWATCCVSHVPLGMSALSTRNPGSEGLIGISCG